MNFRPRLVLSLEVPSVGISSEREQGEVRAKLTKRRLTPKQSRIEYGNTFTQNQLTPNQ